MKIYDDAEKIKQQYINIVSNSQGQQFEKAINAACITYREMGMADINKMPEPYRVMSLDNTRHTFIGRHTAKAQPDFIGTLKGGQTIVFEAKLTISDKIKRGVLTDTQIKSLQHHFNLGAVVGVRCSICDNYFFVPWKNWQCMKQLYGRKYLTVEDIEEFRIKFNGSVLFLDYVNKKDV